MDEPTEDQGPPPDFNEAAYLVAFPKIAENIRAGLLKSGYDHYVRKGASEGRLEQPRYRKALAEQALLARLSAPAAAPVQTAPGEKPAGPPPIASGLDALVVAAGQYCLIIGWVDDRADRLSAISLRAPDGRQTPSLNIARCRRADVEVSIGAGAGAAHLFGFFTLIELDEGEAPGPGCAVQIHCAGATLTHLPRIRTMRPEELRDSAFEYFARAQYFGPPTVEAFLQLEGGIGDKLIQMSQTIAAGLSSRAQVERHGPHDRRFCASIIVCLYGKIEFLFLQAALFSVDPRAADYEFVFVSNSPELTEPLQREARLAAQLYGLSLTMVYLPGNAGFGAANNAAVQHASSDRVLILNPDVFPRHRDWAARHADLVASLPAAQTRLFGAPLFYDDGSLMHGGMYFMSDIGLSLKSGTFARREILRVEHYGKGAPPDLAAFQCARRVPAVTGAFISADRAWFERLGGFSESYIFGHYEDADLCLKSWQEGGEVWFHPLAFWHLEGKGSQRRAEHEGGAAVNRWLFTRTWLASVRADFLGPEPGRIAL